MQPSKYILRKAFKLGRKMARQEKRLRPHLQLAAEFGKYPAFRTAHRQAMQQISAFRPWDERVRELVIREGHGQGIPMENPACWEAYGRELVSVIYSAFWFAWEEAFRLEDMHFLAVQKLVQQRARTTASPIVRPLSPMIPTTPMPLAPETEDEEDGLWEKVADKLFGDMDGDGDASIWNLPMPDKLATKGPQPPPGRKPE